MSDPRSGMRPCCCSIAKSCPTLCNGMRLGDCKFACVDVASGRETTFSEPPDVSKVSGEQE